MASMLRTLPQIGGHKQEAILCFQRHAGLLGASNKEQHSLNIFISKSGSGTCCGASGREPEELCRSREASFNSTFRKKKRMLVREPTAVWFLLRRPVWLKPITMDPRQASLAISHVPVGFQKVVFFSKMGVCRFFDGTPFLLVLKINQTERPPSKTRHPNGPTDKLRRASRGELDSRHRLLWPFGLGACPVSAIC